MLAISVAFAASGVASATPWVETAPSTDTMDLSTTSSTAGATITQWVEAGTPTDDAPVNRASSSPDVDADPEGDLDGSHGDFVSDQAHASAGTGAGCEVSTVARSELGKDDNGQGAPDEKVVGACEDTETTSAVDDATTTPGDKSNKQPSTNGKAKGQDKTPESGGDE